MALQEREPALRASRRSTRRKEINILGKRTQGHFREAQLYAIELSFLMNSTLTNKSTSLDSEYLLAFEILNNCVG